MNRKVYALSGVRCAEKGVLCAQPHMSSKTKCITILDDILHSDTLMVAIIYAKHSIVATNNCYLLKITKINYVDTEIAQHCAMIAK